LAKGIKIKVKYKGKGDTGHEVTVQYKPITGPHAGKWMEYTKVYGPTQDAEAILAAARQGIEAILATEIAPEPSFDAYRSASLELDDLPVVKNKAL